MTKDTEALTPFVREERFIVIKRKHLVDDEERKLRDFLYELNVGTVECVVVESDWPEYETVWQMIEARASPTPASAELGFDPTAEVGDDVFPHDASEIAPSLSTRRMAEILGTGWRAHPPHPAPVDPVAGGEADTIIAKLDFKMLREAVSGIADDWMSSKEHHQGWVLIPIDKFSKLRVADRIMKMRGNNAALKGPAA